MEALELGKYILTKCFKEGNPINNYHLQNILYVLQRKWLQTYDCTLFPDDFEAWVFGPIIPTVYYNFCSYGAMNITFDYTTFIDVDTTKVTDYIFDVCKGIKDPWEYLYEARKQGGAWDNVYDKGAGARKVIPYERIKLDV